MRLATTAALGIVLLSVGCGQEGEGDSSALPDCADVWVEGAELPKNYDGCAEEGLVIVPALLDCNEQGGQWTTYGNRLAGVLGDEIFAVPGAEHIILSC